MRLHALLHWKFVPDDVAKDSQATGAISARGSGGGVRAEPSIDKDWPTAVGQLLSDVRVYRSPLCA